MARCNNCDTPRKINNFGKLDCPKCNPGNFSSTEFLSKPLIHLPDVVDSPVFVEEQGVELIVESEE